MKTRLGVDEIPLLGRRCEIRRGRVKSPQLARAAVKSSALLANGERRFPFWGPRRWVSWAVL